MSKVPRIRSAYDGSRVAVLLLCPPEEGRTKQSFKEAADVNSVLAKYARTGVWSRTAREPMYGDVSMIGDMKTAMDRVLSAQDDVARLPEAARKLYQEDPEGFLEAAVKADRREALEELGLLEVREPEANVEPKAGPAGVPAPGVAPAAQ